MTIRQGGPRSRVSGVDLYGFPERDELEAPALVDLGTMLFYRGWSNDAVTYFKQALDIDPKMSEAW